MKTIGTRLSSLETLRDSLQCSAKRKKNERKERNNRDCCKIATTGCSPVSLKFLRLHARGSVRQGVRLLHVKTAIHTFDVAQRLPSVKRIVVAIYCCKTSGFIMKRVGRLQLFRDSRKCKFAVDGFDNIRLHELCRNSNIVIYLFIFTTVIAITTILLYINDCRTMRYLIFFL